MPILATHVGSLPRPAEVADLVFAVERGEREEDAAFDALIGRATTAVLARQRETGIDVPSDGEMSKISYATYIKDRLTGFEGDSPRRAPADLKDFPSFMERQAKGGGTPAYRRPQCVGPVGVKTLEPLHADIRRMKAGMAAAGYDAGFMNSATPGVIALFQPSVHHAGHEDYVAEVGEAMRAEYEAIVEAGLLLQLDSPDLGLGRHMMFPDLTIEEFRAVAEMHVEVLNHALRNVPGDRVRIHVCWGNYEGPHTHDVPMEAILSTVVRAKPRALLFETSNPRHAHEWRAFADAEKAGTLPEDYVLVPGVIDSTTNFVEHPQLVAERIERFASIVGPERVMAGTDCGFATFAGFGAVDAEIAWAKLGALAEGVALANEGLRARAA